MSLKCLGVVLLATLAIAEIPPYIKICGRRDPNLGKCIGSSVEAIRDKLRTGIPELDVPSTEPLHLDKLPLSQTEALTAFARNVSITGASNFDLTSYKIDFDKKRVDLAVFFKRIVLDAEYDVKVKILFPISGRGPVRISADNIGSDVAMHYKLIKRNGSEYMFFTAMTTKLYINDYKAEFQTSEGPEGTLATAINAAIEGGQKEILESITPSIEKVISTTVLKIANSICTHFTFDELFPDRE